MKYKITSFFLLAFIALQAQTGSITGKVIDKNIGEFLPYVNIIVKADDTIITGGITDDEGLFTIKKIPYGSYVLHIQYIGYQSEEFEIVLSPQKRSINIGTTPLIEDTVSLEGIEIIAERSTIEQKIDRKVIHIGKDLTTAGASASDIMGNIASVSINQDGDVSLRGNENVRVLIDGKPTNNSTREILQQIPTTAIKTIELITNPSAKYNPEGMSGIINIRLKKNTNLGFNGSINTGFTYGERARYNNSLALNYRAGKVNFYGSYGNKLGKGITKGDITRTIERTNQSTFNINDNSSHIFKFGLDYFLNDKNTFSVYTNQNLVGTTIDGKREITFFDDPSQNFNQRDVSDNDNTNATYNFDFKHEFSKENHSIELEVDYNTLQSDKQIDFSFTGNNPINNYQELIDDTRNNTTVNLDYVYPISEKSTVEAGLETRFRRTDNLYTTGNPNFNNATFSYDRDIYSFYTTISSTINKWQYNIGIRLEGYSVKSQFFETGQPSFLFNDHLFNIYPSGFLKYTPEKASKNTYQLSFSRRVDRPSLNQINPIRQLNTPQIIITGNPSLVPQFTNSVELNYTRKLDKGSLTVGGFYRRIYDEINRRGFFDANNPNLLIIDYDNFDTNNAYGFELSSNYRFTNWWSYTGSFDIYSRKQKGVIENESVTVSNTLLNIKLNQSFKASKNLTFQFFTFFSGKQKILQYELKSNFFINTGARYSFAQKRGSISLNFNDIFKTQRFAFEAYKTIIQEGAFRTDSRAVYLGLSYRFGGKGKKIKRKKRDDNLKKDKIL